jgi:hypothetical protein
MKSFDPKLLEPGDTLLYRPVAFSGQRVLAWLFGRLIALRTWRNISHVEIYAGNGVWQQSPRRNGVRWHLSGRASFASRDGKGVDIYPLRLSELAYVLRPMPAVGERLDMKRGDSWFALVQGQRYDWLGLTRFFRTSIKSSRSRMFCSAFWLRFYRACGFNPFAARVDADSIAPGDIVASPKLEIVWDDGQDVDFSDLVALPV